MTFCEILNYENVCCPVAQTLFPLWQIEVFTVILVAKFGDLAAIVYIPCCYSL